MTAVHCEALTKRFVSASKTVTPVDGVTLDIPSGTVTAIIGKSGCGKTTLLRLLAGLEKPDTGTVRFMNEAGVVKKPRLSVVFQEHRLFPWMTARENVEVAVRDWSADIRREKVDAVLELTGLTDAAGAYPKELSGGMSQRVGLARALVSEPDLLLMDEAFSALDALTRHQLYEEFTRIYCERPITTVLVTHDVTEALLLSKRVCRLEAGKLLKVYDFDAPYPRHLSTPGISELAEQILTDLFNTN